MERLLYFYIHFMKKVSFAALALVLMFSLSACNFSANNTIKSDDNAMMDENKGDAMMEEKEDSMMEDKDDAMMEDKDDAMMEIKGDVMMEVK
jgi:uncharacterized membrane protein